MTTSWGRIALLYAIGVLAAGQLGIVPPLVPALQRDLGLSLASAGMTVSIVTLVGALFGLPAGGWSERIGHARALRIGILIMASAAALCAAADDASTLLAARGLAGAGYLLVVVACPSLMVSTAEPRHHAFALSLWGTFVPAGIAAAGIAAAAFADGAGWRIIFAVDAVLLALALIVAIAAAFGIAGSILAGRLMRRGASPGRLVAVGLIASTVIAALSFSAAAPVPLAVAGFAVCFALGGLVPAAAFASVPQVATDRRAVGPVNGLLAQTGSLGSLAGPPALALWVEATDWSLAPVMLVAVAAIGAACALAVKPA